MHIGNYQHTFVGYVQFQGTPFAGNALGKGSRWHGNINLISPFLVNCSQSFKSPIQRKVLQFDANFQRGIGTIDPDKILKVGYAFRYFWGIGLHPVALSFPYYVVCFLINSHHKEMLNIESVLWTDKTRAPLDHVATIRASGGNLDCINATLNMIFCVTNSVLLNSNCKSWYSVTNPICQPNIICHSL